MSAPEPLFYNSATGHVVLVAKSPEGYLLKTALSDAPVDPQVPILDPLSVALHDDDVYVVDSMKSGTRGRPEDGLYNRVLGPILRDMVGVAHRYIATENAELVADFAASLRGNGRPVTVILLSGDLLVNELVNLLSEGNGSSLKLATVPLGTGNSLALSIGLACDLKAVQKLLTYKADSIKPLNLYEAQFPAHSRFLIQDKPVGDIVRPQKFVVVLSWAFHAALVADSDTPEMRQHGLDRFKLAAFNNLLLEQRYEGSTSIEGRVFEGPYAYWVVTPAKRFEPTFEVLPLGNIFDRNLHWVAFNTEDDHNEGKYIMDVMHQVYNKGLHVNNPKVRYEKVVDGETIVLRTKKALRARQRRFCLDGAIVELPEAELHEVTVKLTGNKHNGWSLSIVS